MIKKSVFIFIILSLIASALNYIAYPLFARLLPSSEYVNITVSLSLFTQISTFLSSIIAITIGLSKSERDESADGKIEILQAFLFKLFIILAAVFLIISPLVMGKLNTPILFAIPISIMMFFSIPIQVISGWFNGKNQMVKLGIVVLIVASSQFIIGVSTSIITHNGLATMLSMTVAQVISLTIIYSVFSSDRLPAISRSLKTKVSTIRDKHIGPLIIYTAVASLSVMAISIVQIADLLILQGLTSVNLKFYTDIYVISRVVFFAGMIFIWPFLGEISVDHHHFNRKPFYKVIGYFTLITLMAIVALYFFGDRLTSILFGSSYSLQLIRTVGILSVLYKYFLLIITAVILYFIVLRRYTVAVLSVIACTLVLIASTIIGSHSDIIGVLLALDTIAFIVAVMSIVALLRTQIRSLR